MRERGERGRRIRVETETEREGEGASSQHPDVGGVDRAGNTAAVAPESRRSLIAALGDPIVNAASVYRGRSLLPAGGGPCWLNARALPLLMAVAVAFSFIF